MANQALQAEIELEGVAHCEEYAGIYALAPVESELKKFSKACGQPVIYWCPHGRIVSPDKAEEAVIYKDTIIVLFWSAPAGDVNNCTIPTACGYPLVSGQQDAIELTDAMRSMGEIIKDGENELALWVDPVLYILFDLTHRSNNVDEILNYLLSRLLDIIGKESPEMRKKKAETENAKLEKVRQVAFSILVAPKETEMLTIKRRMQTRMDEIAMCRSRLEDLGLEVAKLEREMRAVSKEDTATKAERAIENIQKMPGVIKVVAYRDNLRVLTDTIFLETEMYKYLIGKFAIEYRHGGEFRLINLNKRTIATAYGDAEKFDHPHVADGLPCLGNLSSVSANIRYGDIDIATQLLIEFLNSYYPAGAHRQVDNWTLYAKKNDAGEWEVIENKTV